MFKKIIMIILIVILSLAFIGGIYWCTTYLFFGENNTAEKLVTSSPVITPSITPLPTLISESPYKTPANVSLVTDIENFSISSSQSTWEYLGNNNEWIKSEIQDSSEDIINCTDYNQEITLTYDYIPDSVIVTVFSKDTQLEIYSSPINNDQVPLINQEGTYTYSITVSYHNEANEYRGNYQIQFDLFIDFPITYEISKTTVTQGDMIKFTATNVNEDEVIIINQELFSRFKLFKQGNIYTGYFPAGYYTTPGDYVISYGKENSELTDTTITVTPYDFNTQYLYIDETIASETKNEASSIEYATYFKPVRLQSNNEPYYTESFVIPAYGHLSTEYGENRYVNDTLTSYHHSGLDIGNQIDSPIYASNNGKVVLSMYLIMTGNTIVIDHGQGLFSVYFHMNSLISSEGDMVERGQQIGYMGTTGFSTGSHLHFTMCYFDTNIEPGYFLVGEPITDENYAMHLATPIN